MKTSEIFPGDVLFVSGKGIIESLIQWVTHSKFYHCAIFVDNGINLVEANGGEKTSPVPLSKYINADNKLYIFRDPTLTNKDRNKIVNYALNHLGIEYNYMDILAELARYELGFPLKYYDEGDKRICSSFVKDCYLSIGKKLTDEKVPSPQDLVGGKVLKLIGKLENK